MRSLDPLTAINCCGTLKICWRGVLNPAELLVDYRNHGILVWLSFPYKGLISNTEQTKPYVYFTVN